MTHFCTALHISATPIGVKSNLETTLNENDLVTITAIAQGGGDSNVLAVIATIAILVFAPEFAGMFGAVGSTGYTVAYAAFTVAGTMLVNKLLPPHFPGVNGGQDFQTSPTYALNGGTNQARIDQPIPIVVGTHKLIPDLASQPYIQFESNDQYLYQTFNLGFSGDVDVSNIKIGNDAIANFQDVSYELSSGNTRRTNNVPN